LIDRLLASHLKVSFMGTARRQREDPATSIDGFARFRIYVRQCRLLDSMGAFRCPFGGTVQASEGTGRKTL
jgi:hypothetical protein